MKHSRINRSRPPVQRKGPRLYRRQMGTGFGFVLLSMLGFSLFFAVPFFFSVLFSFSSSSGVFRFSGFSNYLELFESPSFRLALWNTFRFAAIGLPLLLVCALGMALMLQYLFRRKMPGISAWFALSLLPMVIPSSAIILFVQVLVERFGVINGLLVKWGMAPVDFLNSSWAFWILMLLFLWKNTAYCSVILLAGLRSIDRSIYEAAQLDGAGTFQAFRYLTLVQLVPFLFFSIVMGVMGIFKIFRESYLLMGDYPPDSAYMLQNFMNNNFLALNYQRLSTASVVFFLGILLFFILMFRFSDRQRD